MPLLSVYLKCNVVSYGLRRQTDIVRCEIIWPVSCWERHDLDNVSNLMGGRPIPACLNSLAAENEKGNLFAQICQFYSLSESREIDLIESAVM